MMVVNCSNCPLRRRSLFVDMSDEEIGFMERFKVGEMVVEPGTAILMEGSNSPQLYTALSGMGVRFKSLEDGRRQVINMVLPGDFLGLQAGVMGEMGHSVEATTAMTLCVFDRARLWEFFSSQPERAYDLTWLAAMEEHFLGEALASIGQHSALEALAWSFMQFYERGRALRLLRNEGMPLPYRQQDIADTLGLSLVHTNKTIAKLRKMKLATWSDGILTVHDPEGLAALAGVEMQQLKPRPLM